MRIQNTYRGDQRSAHSVVTVEAANSLYNISGVDWPVSGDQSRIDYGKRGMPSTIPTIDQDRRMLCIGIVEEREGGIWTGRTPSGALDGATVTPI